MKLEFDPAKNAKNMKERDLPFTLAVEFDWTTALIVRSDRQDEVRYFALGDLNGRLHALVFTKAEDTVRVISLRRANKNEVKRYEKARS